MLLYVASPVLHSGDDRYDQTIHRVGSGCEASDYAEGAHVDAHGAQDLAPRVSASDLRKSLNQTLDSNSNHPGPWWFWISNKVRVYSSAVFETI